MILPRNGLPAPGGPADNGNSEADGQALRVLDHAADVSATDAPGDASADPVADALSLQALLSQVLAELQRHRRRPARLAVRTSGRVVLLRPEEIGWVEAEGNYVRLHVGPESHLLRESMKNMESRLSGDLFVRIHRSAIVNVEHIRELQPWLHGEYVVILRDGTRLMASRVFADRLDRLMA